MKKKFWSKEDDQIMMDLYPNTSTAKVAKKLKVSVRACYSRANLLGLVKDVHYLNTPASGRLQPGTRVGKGSYFQKGHTPFNKGLKQTDFMSKEAIKKTKATRFKKNHIPHNAKHDGAVVMHKDKTGKEYQYIRLSLGKWQLYHRYLYEKHHKVKLKQNQVVRFKDGNEKNCTIENLQLVTTVENMAMNTIHQYPPELKEVIKLNNKLQRKISKIEQHGKEQTSRP